MMIALNKPAGLSSAGGNDQTVRILSMHSEQLADKACRGAIRNFSLNEWLTYMGSLDNYLPTCPNTSIPEDVINEIKATASTEIRSGQVASATHQLDQLNNWLQTNGQFNALGVDIQKFIAGVPATSTAEAMPTPTHTSTPSVTPTPVQLISPLQEQTTSPLPSPTVMPPATGTPVASSPAATPVRLPSSS